MEPMTRRRVRRAVGVTGLAAAALLAYSSLAQAEPEGAGVIKACVNKTTGDVRIPTSHKGGSGCGPLERSVTWNVKGPRGPQGPAGLLGPGQSVTKTVDVPGNSTGTATVAQCPKGMVATGGGFAFGSPQLAALFSRPEPASGGPVTAWRGVFSNTGDLPIPAEVYVVCYPATK